MTDDTPYQKAKTQKLPYVKIRVDYRTAGEESWIEFEGPVTKEEATRVTKVIGELCADDDDGDLHGDLGSVLRPKVD